MNGEELNELRAHADWLHYQANGWEQRGNTFQHSYFLRKESTLRKAIRELEFKLQ